MDTIFLVHPDATPYSHPGRDDKFLELYESISEQSTLFVPIFAEWEMERSKRKFEKMQKKHQNVYPIVCGEEYGGFPSPEQIDEIDDILSERYSTTLMASDIYLSGQQKNCCMKTLAEGLIFGKTYFEAGSPYDLEEPKVDGSRVYVLRDYSFDRENSVTVRNPENEETDTLTETGLPFQPTTPVNSFSNLQCSH